MRRFQPAPYTLSEQDRHLKSVQRSPITKAYGNDGIVILRVDTDHTLGPAFLESTVSPLTELGYGYHLFDGWTGTYRHVSLVASSPSQTEWYHCWNCPALDNGRDVPHLWSRLGYRTQTFRNQEMLSLSTAIPCRQACVGYFKFSFT